MDRLVQNLQAILQALDESIFLEDMEAMLRLNEEVNHWLDRAEQYPASIELVRLFNLLRRKYELRLNDIQERIMYIKGEEERTAWSNAG